MYRSDLDNRDKGGAIAAVVAIHALLLFAVLHQWGDAIVQAAPEALKVFDVRDIPPPEPPPPPPPVSQKPQVKPKLKEGGSAPKNIRSQATTVVAPTSRIALPTPVPATETPRQGSDPTQGASDVRGPGTGAGGFGNGTGSGSGGNGPGGGGEGGAAYPPQLVTPVLRGRDFPRDVLDDWPRGADLFLRLRVDSRGYVSECIVDRGTGIARIDSEVCDAVHQRLRFRPALSRSRQPVAGWFGYRQSAPR